MKHPALKKERFVRRAAAAAVIAAFALPPAFAADFSDTNVTESVPTGYSAVTITNDGESPSLFLAKPGDTVSVTAADSVSITNSSSNAAISSAAGLTWNPETMTVTGPAPSAGSITVGTTSETGTVTITSGSDSTPSVLWASDGSGGDLSLKVDLGVVSAPAISGPIVVSGKGAAADITVTVVGDDPLGDSSVYVLNGGTLTLTANDPNVAGDWRGKAVVSGKDSFFDFTLNNYYWDDSQTLTVSDQAGVRITATGGRGEIDQSIILTRGASGDFTVNGGATMNSSLDITEGSTASVTVGADSHWENDAAVTVSHFSSDTTEKNTTTDFTADISGEWDGTLTESGKANSRVTVNEGGVWKFTGSSEIRTESVLMSLYTASSSNELGTPTAALTLTGASTATVIDNGTWIGRADVSEGSAVTVTVGGDTGIWRPSGTNENIPTNSLSYAIASFSDELGDSSALSTEFTEDAETLTLAGQSTATVTVTDSGKWYGAASVTDGSSATITIGENAIWRYSGAAQSDSSSYSAAAFTMLLASQGTGQTQVSGQETLSVSGSGSKSTVTVDGQWYGQAGIEDGGSADITVNGLWAYFTPEDAADAQEPVYDFSNLGVAEAAGGSLTVTVNQGGKVYGLMRSENTGTEAKVTVNEGGTWSYIDPEQTVLITSAGADQPLFTAESGSHFEVVNNGVMTGTAEAADTGSIKVTIGETGEWTAFDPIDTVRIQEAAGSSEPIVILEAMGGGSFTIEDNGTLRGVLMTEPVFSSDTETAVSSGTVNVSPTGKWTYYDPLIAAAREGDESSGLEQGQSNLAGYAGSGTLKSTVAGKLYGFLSASSGTTVDVTINKGGVWSWKDPDDTVSSLDTFPGKTGLQPLLMAAPGSTVKATIDGQATGDMLMVATMMSTTSAPVSFTGSVGGTWDGALLGMSGNYDITVDQGGVWTRTASTPVIPYLQMPFSLDDRAVMSMFATVSSMVNGNVTVIDNGSLTGGAAVVGSDSSMDITVNGTWNTGKLPGTDEVMPAYVSGGKLNVTVGEKGSMTGNVWAVNGGTAEVKVAGTWTGTVKAPVFPASYVTSLNREETDPSTISGGGDVTTTVTTELAVSSLTEASGTDVISASLAQSDGGDSGTTPVVTPTADSPFAPITASAGTVNVTLVGSTGVWNMTESTAVDSLNVGSGTVNFPTVTDASSFTGSTLTVNGPYTSDGGTLVMNTALDGDDSPTDKLVVNGDTSGKTYIRVNKVGGTGKQTDTGIKLVEVTGNSAGTFETAGTVRAGTYVYSMKQSGSDWYLTNLLGEVAAAPSGASDITDRAVRPETASYATNLYAANTLFSMKLSDRMGESAYTEALKDPNRNARGVWIRTEGGHTRHEMADGQTTTRGNWGLVQVGGDIASWPASGANRFHVGLMAGYAHERSNTGSSVVNYQSKGKISGYSAGIYGTWMNSNPTGTGPYVDTWLMYQRFKNTVTTSDCDVDETYHTKGFTASLEAGYTFGLKDWKSASGVDNATRLRVEGQVIRMGVRGGDHFEESTGTAVAGIGAGNVRTRVGLTAFHLFSNDAKGTAVKPYLTLNWFHDTKSFGSVMDGVKDTITGSRNFGEVKVGLEGKVSKSVNLWGAAGYQQGSHGLRNVEAVVGAKILF